MTELVDSGVAGEQPLTRRQLRERERMLAQQHPQQVGDADAVPAAENAYTEPAPTEGASIGHDPIKHVASFPSPAHASSAAQSAAGVDGAANPDGDAESRAADDDSADAAWTVPDTGGHSVHTSCLVLPTLPAPGNTHEVIDGTGAILVTGSMEAPLASGAPGALSDRYDSAEIDRLIDAADGEGHVVFDTEPVSATRAVSNATSASVLIRPPARNRISTPVVLACTGGVLLVVVGTLLSVAFGMGL
ncbi:hypothetical protein [Planctomonas psychrotolerans]|uniref:hypothetical protein n=1 Tax=Planctomonas psychrotolerans TaxID=2528712 RepID=UPI0012396D65|nr:hypothetical protein [Planctomonas psychrotolerans]